MAYSVIKKAAAPGKPPAAKPEAKPPATVKAAAKAPATAPKSIGGPATTAAAPKAAAPKAGAGKAAAPVAGAAKPATKPVAKAASVNAASQTHSSVTAVNTVNMADEATKNYQWVGSVIRQFGTPNRQFPKDKDVEFGVIRRELDGQLAGLPTILKNMKGKKMVDYRDNFIKDETVVTLVEDYYQEAVPQGITYDQIVLAIKGDTGGHIKSDGGASNAAILAAEEQRRKAELLQKQAVIKETEAKRRALPATPQTGQSVFNASKTQKFDPTKDVAAAKAQGYDMGEEGRSEHDSQKRRDPKSEVQAAKAQGYVAPEEAPAAHSSRVRKNPQAEVAAAKANVVAEDEDPRAEHDSQKRRDPRAEVAAAKATGYVAPEDDLSAHSSRVRKDPAAEIAAAKASGYVAPEEEHYEIQKEQIRGGAVSQVKNKFSAAASAPAVEAKLAGGKKWNPPPKAAVAPPTPSYEEQPAEEAPAEAALAEEHAPTDETPLADEAPAEEAHAEEAPQEEAPPAEETPPAEEVASAGGQQAKAVYDYAGEAEGDLAFSNGDIINILDTSDPSGWWQGELNGVTELIA